MVHAVINKLITFFFPYRKDYLLLKDLNQNSFVPRIHFKEDDQILSTLSFQDPLVRAAIHEVKYHKNEQAIALLAPVVSRLLEKMPSATIIPIPLSAARCRQRGHNQVVTLLEPVLRNTTHVLATHVLERCKDTPSQTSLSRAERFDNITGAFVVPDNSSATITGAHIILIDDVSTTGATLHEASKAIRIHQPASLTLVAIAH